MSAVTRRFSEALAIASASVQGSCTIGNTAATPLARSFSQEAGSSLAEPDKTMTGFPAARRAMPCTAFPPAVWPSTEPSPVTIKSAVFTRSSNFIKSRSASIPEAMRPLRKQATPAPAPPAAPPPGRELTFAPCFSKSPATTRSPASKRFTSSASAPFCGPKT